MPAGPIAEAAIYRARCQALGQQLADTRAILERRAREAYETGLQTGRGAWPIGLLMGAMAGSALTGLYFVLVG